jgi:hypothetical protein
MFATLQPSSLHRTILTVAACAALIGGCSGGAGDPASPAASPTALPSPSPDVVDAGTITLTDTACTWDGNPGSMKSGRLSLAVRNETDDFGLFIIQRIRDGRTWDEGRDAIAVIQEALKTGAEWPEEVFDVSDAVEEGSADAGGDDVVSLAATSGTYGVVCSANTSPTGDVLTTFLVGPLEVAQP